MRAHLKYCAAPLMAGCLLTAPAAADPISLDQSFTPASGGVFHLINECCAFVAQTYTAGITGTLAGVAVAVESNSPFPLNISLRSAPAGLPSPAILAETTLSGSSSPLLNVFSFPTLVEQIAGEQYAIVVNFVGAPPPGPGQGLGFWRGGLGYPEGTALASVNGSSWFESAPGSDASFQTYVSPVPEPSTLLLVGACGALVARMRSKRERRIPE
jgi:hypothetical protein